MRTFWICLFVAVMTTACSLHGGLKPVDLPPAKNASVKQPPTVVDVLVISRPDFEPKKYLGLLPPSQTSVQRSGALATEVARMMEGLTSELRYSLTTAGLPGVVGLERQGYRPSPRRTHVLLIVPTEANQSVDNNSKVVYYTSVKLRAALYQVAGQELIWQGTSTYMDSRHLTKEFVDSVLAMLRDQGVPFTPVAQAAPATTGIPVALGDALTRAQAALADGPGTVKTEWVQTAQKQTVPAIKLPERGMTITFGERATVSSIKLNAPFDGDVKGVKLGASRQSILASLGEPTREFEPIPLFKRLLYRGQAGSVRYDFDGSDKLTSILLFLETAP